MFFYTATRSHMKAEDPGVSSNYFFEESDLMNWLPADVAVVRAISRNLSPAQSVNNSI